MNRDTEKRELLTGMVGFLGDFEGGIRQTVSLFQEGSIEKARQNTIQVIDGLGWIMEAIAVLQDMVEIDVTQLTATLEQLQISLENDDDVMISDLFENELLPVLAKWKQRMLEIDGTPLSEV